ncbi:WG repeat-containing protein [Leptospira weilii]|uniref:WG repeat-containing protein n=1 Tax=Leptospira weilii TaxID=28184 RepID=UPI001F352488|nr:WG repeat-containing protein [Leptospira weilii]
MNTSIPSYAGDFESDSVVQDPYSQYGTPTSPNISASVMMELIWVVAKLFERPYAALVGDKYGYIDKTGKFIIPSQFDNARSFSEGLAAVQIGKKWGFIDKTGNFAIPPRFHYAYSFSEGLAAVQICEEGGDNGGCWKWKYGFIDKTGNFIIPPQFYSADSFSEGLALIDFCEMGQGRKCRYGYIDKTGNFVIQPQFYSAYSFLGGLASVQIGGKWGMVNKEGDIVIRPQFENSIFFSEEGLASVQICETGPEHKCRYEYIDKTGNFVIQPPQFKNTDSFSEDLVPASIHGQYGYMDKTGNFVIQPQFYNANYFSEGLASVKMCVKREPGQGCSELKYGYIDKTGNFVIQPQFDIASHFSGGLALAVRNQIWIAIQRNDRDRRCQNLPPNLCQ